MFHFTCNGMDVLQNCPTEQLAKLLMWSSVESTSFFDYEKNYLELDNVQMI